MSDFGNTPAPEHDPFAADPFFKLRRGSEWNACIGRQGHEENYLDGYIDAAIELASAVIDKKMHDKRDTLVLPILYNARHSVELVLKFVADRLQNVGVLQAGSRSDHDIQKYWNHIYAASSVDEALRKQTLALQPFIESLSRIDEDGQELRYHLNRSSDPSLSDRSLANIEVIRESLSKLSKIISHIKYRTLNFVDERATGTFTTRCSRSDLAAIANLMPPRVRWHEHEFDQQKKVVKERFCLSNNQFSKALDIIQSSSELNAMLGVETELKYLTDDEVVWVVEQWRRMHPIKDPSENQLGLDYFDPARFDRFKEDAETQSSVVNAIEKKLSRKKIADLEAIFYISRDRIFSEYYERRIEQALRVHSTENNPQKEITHLIEKTNFLMCLQQSAAKLGRIQLAERLTRM